MDECGTRGKEGNLNQNNGTASTQDLRLVNKKNHFDSSLVVCEDPWCETLLTFSASSITSSTKESVTDTTAKFNSLVKKFSFNMDIISASPVLKSFLAGSFSGTCSTIMFQPLDLVKTRLQNPVGAASRHSASMMAIMGHILKNEQVFGLWKGMTPSITRCVPGVGLYFSTLYSLKSHFVPPGKEPGPIQAMALGISARTFSGVVLIPVTVIKTRFESGVYDYTGMTNAFKIIYRTEGLRGLCSGLIPTLFRDAPYSGLYLMFYTQIKKNIPQELLKGDFSPFYNFSCGVMAGILASGVTQPADVLKTKMQLYPEKFNGLYSVIKHVHQKYGIKGYFKGLVPRMLRRTLMTAMAWTVYEQVTRSIGLK